MLIILLNLSKERVTLMRQTPFSPFQATFMPPTLRNALTGTLSDSLLVNSPWKSTERLLITDLFPSGIKIPNISNQIQGMPGEIFSKTPHFVLLFSHVQAKIDIKTI